MRALGTILFFYFFFMKRFYTKKARNSNIDVIMHLGERKYISKQKKTAFLCAQKPPKEEIT